MDTSQAPWQLRCIDARSEQPLRPTEPLQRPVETAMEILCISGDGVCQGAFHMVPDQLIGIEFWSIRRQQMWVQPRVPAQEVADNCIKEIGKKARMKRIKVFPLKGLSEMS